MLGLPVTQVGRSITALGLLIAPPRLLVPLHHRFTLCGPAALPVLAVALDGDLIPGGGLSVALSGPPDLAAPVVLGGVACRFAVMAPYKVTGLPGPRPGTRLRWTGCRLGIKEPGRSGLASRIPRRMAGVGLRRPRSAPTVASRGRPRGRPNEPGGIDHVWEPRSIPMVGRFVSLGSAACRTILLSP